MTWEPSKALAKKCAEAVNGSRLLNNELGVLRAAVESRELVPMKCEGCNGNLFDCVRIWNEQRKCCPDCTHG